MNATEDTVLVEDGVPNVEEERYSPHAGKTAYLTLLFIASLIANTILFMQQFKKVRKPNAERNSMPYMLLNLAVVNLVSTFFCVLVFCIWINVVWWYGGNFLCKVVMFLMSFEHFVRPYSVVAFLMAYIAERGTRRDGKLVALFFLIPAWAIGVIFCLPRASKMTHNLTHRKLLRQGGWGRNFSSKFSMIE